jgi:uncharacterized protein (DUF3820 family)
MSLKEYEFTRMPWGKHKGKFLSELPDSYILWAIKNWRDKGTMIMFETEAKRRKLKAN